MNAFWHKLRFFMGDAWEELRHSPGVNLLAVGTLAALVSEFLGGMCTGYGLEVV